MPSDYLVWQYRDDDAPVWRRLCRATLDRWHGPAVRVITRELLIEASIKAGGPDADRVRRMLPLQREDLARALWLHDGGLWVSDSVIVLRDLTVVQCLTLEFDAVLFSPYLIHEHWLPEVCASRARGALMTAAREAALRSAGRAGPDVPRLLGRRLFSELCPRMIDGTDILKFNSYYFWPVPSDAVASAASLESPTPGARRDTWCAALGELPLALDALDVAALGAAYPGLIELYRRGGAL